MSGRRKKIYEKGEGETLEGWVGKRGKGGERRRERGRLEWYIMSA